VDHILEISYLSLYCHYVTLFVNIDAAAVLAEINSTQIQLRNVYPARDSWIPVSTTYWSRLRSSESSSNFPLLPSPRGRARTEFEMSKPYRAGRKPNREADAFRRLKQSKISYLEHWLLGLWEGSGAAISLSASLWTQEAGGRWCRRRGRGKKTKKKAKQSTRGVSHDGQLPFCGQWRWWLSVLTQVPNLRPNSHPQPLARSPFFHFFYSRWYYLDIF
jgi:hypothetical protein